MKKVAIQGIKGSFHEVAARSYFGDGIETVECESFPSFFKELARKETQWGIMAIENTIAGTILPNYELLKKSHMNIVGEEYLRIRHNLMALPGQHIEDLREVRSHPMAILQCQEFFDQHPHIRLVSNNDTAGSAEEIRKNNLEGIGAIASSLAADHFELEIISSGIETNHANFTRFLVLHDKDHSEMLGPEGDKASISFHLSHRPGSLAQVLQTFSYYNINLTKIQSLPLVGREFEYCFHVDAEYDDYEIFQTCLGAIKPFLTMLRILGEYKRRRNGNGN